MKKRDIEKHRKKVELLTTEYYSLQTTSEKKISELETIIEEMQQKLVEFEGLDSKSTPNLSSEPL